MKISVVIATYNGEKYLQKQIDSILAQTLKPDEIIVTDDLSTDNTIAILEGYEADARLKFFVNPEKLGVADNFKKAVSLAKQENFIALCDQDDEWAPDKLEKTAEILNRINDDATPCMVYTDLILLDKDNKVIANSFRDMLGHNKYQHNLETLLYTNFVNGCTVLMNQKAKQEFINMPADVRSHDEWLALAVFSFGKTEYIRQPFVRYKLHNSNFSIPADFKLPNRFYSNVKHLYNALFNKNDFLTEQIKAVKKFYDFNAARLSKENKILFEKFLSLDNRPYLYKKLNYMLTVRKNKI